jgi:hypothetical protein
MAYLVFVDESGYDSRESPYAVLAGVAIQDQDLWNVVTDLQAAELDHFGTRYSQGARELKGKKILKRKVYRQAANLPPIPKDQRRTLAKRCLEMGDSAGLHEITALAQAKLDYVEQVLEICARFRCKVFASIVNRNSPAPDPTILRKDYSYLFERIFYFLEDVGPSALGIVVFDELEKSQSHILLNQMDRYFKLTSKGRARSSRIIPEPFFVHSDLTTGVQIADLVAYIISWGFRLDNMTEPARGEMAGLVNQVCQLRHRAVREVGNNPNFVIWSFAVIDDLRGVEDQDQN